jgi:hypothetical protein
MTIVRGGPAGPDGAGGAYPNEVESDRAAWWHALGGRQGVLKGFAHAGVAGQMALDFTPGAALVGERAADGNASLDRGYFVWSDATTRVSFGPASASARNDAVVAAFVDVEDGPVGTGGLEVGPHLVVVPGVSGVTTPRTDSEITGWLGRGGWVRLMNVPIAAGSTEIAVSGISIPSGAYQPADTGWLLLTGYTSGWTGDVAYRKIRKTVYLRGAATRTSGSATTIGALPAGFRPAASMQLSVRHGSGASHSLTFLIDASTGELRAGSAAVNDVPVQVANITYPED